MQRKIINESLWRRKNPFYWSFHIWKDIYTLQNLSFSHLSHPWGAVGAFTSTGAPGNFLFIYLVREPCQDLNPWYSYIKLSLFPPRPNKHKYSEEIQERLVHKWKKPLLNVCDLRAQPSSTASHGLRSTSLTMFSCFFTRMLTKTVYIIVFPGLEFIWGGHKKNHKQVLRLFTSMFVVVFLQYNSTIVCIYLYKYIYVYSICRYIYIYRNIFKIYTFVLYICIYIYKIYVYIFIYAYSFHYVI